MEPNLKRKVSISENTNKNMNLQENKKRKESPPELFHTEEGTFQESNLVKGKRNFPGDKTEEGDFQNGSLVNGKVTFQNGNVDEGTFLYHFGDRSILINGRRSIKNKSIETGDFDLETQKLVNGKIIHLLKDGQLISEGVFDSKSGYLLNGSRANLDPSGNIKFIQEGFYIIGKDKIFKGKRREFDSEGNLIAEYEGVRHIDTNRFEGKMIHNNNKILFSYGLNRFAIGNYEDESLKEEYFVNLFSDLIENKEDSSSDKPKPFLTFSLPAIGFDKLDIEYVMKILIQKIASISKDKLKSVFLCLDPSVTKILVNVIVAMLLNNSSSDSDLKACQNIINLYPNLLIEAFDLNRPKEELIGVLEIMGKMGKMGLNIQAQQILNSEMQKTELYLMETEDKEVTLILIQDLINKANEIQKTEKYSTEETPFLNSLNTYLRALLQKREKNNENRLSPAELNTLGILIEDHKSEKRDKEATLDKILLKSLNSTSSMSILFPKSKNDTYEVNETNFEKIIGEFKQNVQKCKEIILKDTADFMENSFLPGMKCLLEEQTSIIQAFQEKKINGKTAFLYNLDGEIGKLPLHLNYMAEKDSSKIKEYINMLIRNILLTYLKAKSAGKFKEWLETCANGALCLEGRMSELLKWSTTLNEIKSFNDIMQELAEKSKDYISTMSDAKDIDNLEKNINFILSHTKNTSCIPDDKWAPEGIIKEELLREFLINHLGFDKES